MCGKVRNRGLKVAFCSKVKTKGVPAFPNIECYYPAALIEYIIQWWDNCSISWDIVQMNISIPLKEWCLLGRSGVGKKLNATNGIVDIFLKTWKKCLSQLFPTLSPLATMIWHPLFQNGIKLDDYEKWKQVGMIDLVI